MPRPRTKRATAPQRDFTICEDWRGRWLAVGSHGLLGGVFLTRKAAERFALR